MGNWAGDSIVYNDVMKDYDQNSMVTMDVIKDSYDRAGFYWWNRNIISSKDGSNRTWYLASPLQFTDKQVEIAILEFEDTRNNRNLPS